MSASPERPESPADDAEEDDQEHYDQLTRCALAYAGGDLSLDDYKAQLEVLLATTDHTTRIKAILERLDAKAAASGTSSGDEPPLGISLGGALSAEWRRARRLTSSTLHLTSESASHTIRYDPILGAQLADLPATKPLRSEQVLNYVLNVFRHNAVSKELLTHTDVHELCIFVCERLYTRSRVDALECTVRRLHYGDWAHRARWHNPWTAHRHLRIGRRQS